MASHTTRLGDMMKSLIALASSILRTAVRISNNLVINFLPQSWYHPECPKPPDEVYGHHPLEQGRIRLLTLYPGKPQDAIKCSLVTQEFCHDLEYRAVSYTWGDPAKTSRIQVQDVAYAVTAQLESALRDLRDLSKPQTLWIDALCINQGNIDEVSNQVSQIPRIYESATQVLVWLGTSSPARSLAVEALEHLTDSSLYLVEHADREPDLESLDGRFAGTNWAENLSEILQSEWWSRVWTLQEAVLASDLVFYCGQSCFSFRALESLVSRFVPGVTAAAHSNIRNLQTVRTRHEFQRLMRECFYSAVKSVSTHSHSSEFWDGNDAKRTQFLHNQQIESLAAQQVTVCQKEIRDRQSDLRRRYLAATESTEIGLLLAERDVLRDFAFNLSSQMEEANYFAVKSLFPGLRKQVEDDYHSILGLMATTRSRQCTQARDRVYGISGLRLRITEDVLRPDYWFETIKIFEDFELEVIIATRSLDIFTLLPLDNLDSVVSWIVDWSQPVTSSLRIIQQQRLTYHTYVQASKNIYKGFKYYNKTISIPGCLCDRIERVASDESDDLLECFAPWAQFVANSFTSNQNRDSPYASTAIPADAILSCMLGCVPEENLRSELDALRSHLTPDNSVDSVRTLGPFLHSRARANSHSRRMFISTQGYIGLAPDTTKVDDIICVLYGGRVPYILRQSGTIPVEGVEKPAYKLVGDSYVAGLMYGEAITMCEMGILQEAELTLV